MSDFSAFGPSFSRDRGWRRGLYRRKFKRVFDLVLAILLVPIVVPLIAVLCLMVKQRGVPSLFGHLRVGRDGVPFRCWKIRTMVPDAQGRLDRILASDPAAAAEWARDHKLRCDPRITPLGRMLRRTSLDELPQIWNVLVGDMSLIGPRPVTADEMAYYGLRQGAYLALRPGISGLWQVSGRNALSYEERVALDVRYHDDISFGADLMILIRTAGAIVARTGA